MILPLNMASNANAAMTWTAIWHDQERIGNFSLQAKMVYLWP